MPGAIPRKRAWNPEAFPRRQRVAAVLDRIEAAAAIPMAALLAASPRRHRFAVARRLAGAAEPFWRVRLIASARLDGYREESLSYLLDRLVRHGIEFDPQIEVRGEELLGAGGVLVASAHFHLNRLFMRWLYDRGRQVTAVAAQEQIPCVWGTRAPLDRVPADAQVFVRLRSRLAAGSVVLLALDVGPFDGGDSHPRWRRVDTVVGPRRVSGAVLRYAEILGVPVLFGSSSIEDGGRVVTNLVSPSAPDSAVMLDEYCEFLRSAAARIARGRLRRRP